MKKVKLLTLSVMDRFVYLLLFSIIFCVVSALLFQLTFMFLQLAGKKEITENISNWVNLKFDGTYKNSPDNVWYNEQEHVWVESVTNQVKIGKLSGNRNLEFGVKNILEEYLQEKGYELSPNSPYKIQVQIVYLDVLSTKKNISVFHKNEDEVVIRMKGVLYKNDKKEKEVMIEESSSEISMSTLIVDQGGKFNQTSLSNALKKGCDKLVTKLFE